jgi:hypothetical protein
VEVKFDGQKLVIDDIIDVTKDGGDYHFQCGYHKIKVSSPQSFNLGQQFATPNYISEPVERDPVFYKNGNNGMSVVSSAARAMRYITEDMWYDYDEHIGSEDMLEEAVINIIKNGDGRNYAYALAGIVKKGVEQGRFKGVPLSMLFWGIVEGHIQEPERVEHPYPESDGGWQLPKRAFTF